MMNNNSLQEVVLNKSGEIYNPINLSIATVIIKGLCCSIGIPLNGSIAITIVRLRRLHRKPRNIFLLAIILSYLSFFIVPMIELIYWSLYSDESMCCAYVATIVVPQGLLLINMLLALIDRYLAINYPLLHLRKMTNRLACCLIITCSILTIFLFKFVYITRLGILRCEILLLHVKMTSIIFVILFALCITMNIVIYRQTKILLRESRIVVATPDDITANSTPMSIQVGRKRLSQLEMEATRTLIIGVTSLCVMPCVNLILIASLFACRLVFGQLACSHFNGMWPFIKDIVLTPAIYGPVIFLVRNKELRDGM